MSPQTVRISPLEIATMRKFACGKSQFLRVYHQSLLPKQISIQGNRT